MDMTTRAQEFLGSDAIGLEQISPYVFKYKFADRSWINTEFIAYLLAQDLAAELGQDWQAESWEKDSPRSNLNTARVLNTVNGLVISIRTRSYGVNAYSKFELAGYYLDPRARKTSQSVEIGVSAHKTPQKIAGDIFKRMIPAMLERGAKVSESETKRIDANMRLQKKCEGLARKYPEIKFSMQNDSEISVSTKYGSKIELSAEIRADNDCFRLISKGYGLRIDDIDSTYGREFLKLVNGGGRNK